VFRHWFVPAVLSLGFVFLFAVANPVISQWIESIKQSIADIVSDLSKYIPASRIFLWGVTGFLIWGLLRLRTERQGVVFVKQPRRKRRTASTYSLDISPAFIVRCLILFNAVFAVQTVMDMCYLWGGAELPQGMTYAEYAHRGAYPLIAAALLAALFVVVTFRKNASEKSMVWARRLVYAWIAQNIFLTLSSVWRLVLYIEVYSLTRLRIAAGIWMLLVAAGLAWICIRIFKSYTNTWLINVNTVTLAAVLFVCCFINFDGIIAGYNVRHCREAGGKGPPVDLQYLKHLGPESLPALIWLDTNYGHRFRARNLPSAYINLLRHELGDVLKTWQGWSLRRGRLQRISSNVERNNTEEK